MSKLLSVSIIIPCRNEEHFIQKCLDSVLENDYPKEKMEIFVVDGFSQDKTRKIVGEYIKKYPFIRLLDNPKFIAATALNIGIKEAKGDLIIRLDAHTTYDKSYISKCVDYSQTYNADNVGGIISITPRDDKMMGKAIVKAMASFLGTGGAKYKGGVEKFEEVDTVPFGCFKKEVFNKVGLFNENLQRSQDMEFNLRLKRSGGKIYLFPDIISYYYVRSDLISFLKHNFIDGVWAIYPFKFTKKLFKLRHYLPLIFVSGLLGLLLLGLFLKPFLYIFWGCAALYTLIIIYSAVKVSFAEKNIAYMFYLPIALATRHFSYGFGSIFGIIKLLK
jgi:glycosyltransferase involved in cell wall biosynthesis